MKNAHPMYVINFLSTCMCNCELTAFQFGSRIRAKQPQGGGGEVQIKATKKRWWGESGSLGEKSNYVVEETEESGKQSRSPSSPFLFA